MTHLYLVVGVIGSWAAVVAIFRRRVAFAWKLVRDRVPELTAARGPKMVLRQLDGKKYRQALATKLIEEAREVGGAKDRYILIDELADLLEVVEAYRVANNIPIQDVNTARLRKFAIAGGYAKGYFLYAVLGHKARR